MNDESKDLLKKCIKELNSSLILYYDYIPSVTAKGTVMMNGRPISVFELLQFTEGKMEIVKEVLGDLNILLKKADE